MSVQAGVWNFDGEPADRNFLARISDEMAEYGPDGEATYFDDPVGMLYRPFHTTPESREERQPHVSSSGKVFTWDGRLDNREELILQLHNDLAAHQTDLALAEAAFERWGTDCFAKLIGDWALAIWDPRNKELFLARDYTGIRHLFYYPKPRSVIWCTNLEPLALCGDQFTLCDEYFAGYLALSPEAHLTPYREIHSVPPGKFVSIRNGRGSVQSYWALNPRFKTRYKTDREYEEHFKHLFRGAVRQRLRTDSPILADLSGGLDSSAIICMADDICLKSSVESPLLDTFSFLIFDEPNVEDTPYIITAEERRGRTGHHVEIRELGDTSPFEYSSFVATPGFSGRPEQNAAKSDIIKRGKYRVLLSGTGGDEMLGQALDPRVQLADLLRQLRFIELTKQLRIWSLLLRRPWIHLLVDALLMNMPVSLRARNTEIARVEHWVNERFAQTQRLSLRQLNATEGSWFWLPSTQDWLQTLTTLSQLMTQTKPSTVETRYPFLDQKLVEFLVSIPTEQLLRPGHRRSLMRRALAGLLPLEILTRQTKGASGRYFPVVLEKHWGKLEGIICSALIASLGYTNQDQFHAALVAAKNGNLPRYSLRLFRALSWELWLREVMARRIVSVQPRMKDDTTWRRLRGVRRRVVVPQNSEKAFQTRLSDPSLFKSARNLYPLSTPASGVAHS